MKDVRIGDITVSNAAPFALIAGPCQLESLAHARMLAERIAEAAAAAKRPWIFKASYDKANRSSLSGKRGLGMEAGLSILAAIRQEGPVPGALGHGERRRQDRVHRQRTGDAL